MKYLALALIIAAAVATFMWYRTTKQPQPLSDVLIVGTSADFPPFSFRDTQNNIAGFDIDIITELAKRLNMQTIIKDRPFGVLLPDIELGQLHVIAAGMTPTPERQKSVKFTKPYITGNPLVIVSLKTQEPITSLEDLKNKKIIVNTGYISDEYMSDIKDVQLLRLPRVADAFTALENNKADAFVVSAYTLKPYLKDLDRDNTKFNTFIITDTDESYALALSKLLPADFIASIEKTLDTMHSDGTIAALKQKWAIV
jgi:arginine/lysine/histidine transporter system substrate-binding protein